MSMTEKEKMLKGMLYDASDKELREIFHRAKDILKIFNNTNTRDLEKRTECLRSLFAFTGDNVYIEPPFYCDYGENIHIGNNVYFNTNCNILDSNKVQIGNNIIFGPSVQIYAAMHPLQGKERIQEGNIIHESKPVILGNDIWIGGGTIICPGVEIGDNVVIGAGSIITKDIPSNSVAVGNPCKVIKKL